MMRICPTCAEGALDHQLVCSHCDQNICSLPARGGHELRGLLLEQKYELEAFLQEGGMGWIYQGRHRKLDSAIAIKLMKPRPGGHHVEQRFLREATAASRLNHPHIVSIIDSGKTPGGLLFIITEYIAGRTLTSLINDGPLPLHQTLRVFSQLLAAVEAAHQRHVIHRDLKPDNIMITEAIPGEHFVKVLDFGIAMLADQQTASTRLTLAGDVFGTPAYMAPEQIRGGELSSICSDLYSCGVILFELLTGRVPFVASSVKETLEMQLHRAPPSVLDHVAPGSIPRELDQILQRALAKDPAHRFQSAADFRRDLFEVVARASGPPLACSACHRTIHTSLDYCSVHCANRAVIPGAAQEHEADPAGQDNAFGLVGRAPQMKHLRQFLDTPGSILEVCGAPGTGRTALLEAAAQAAEKRQLTVLRCRPDPSGAMTPWLPIRMLLADLLQFAVGSTLETLRMRAEWGSHSGVRSGAHPWARALQDGLAVEDVVGLIQLFDPPCTGRHMEDAVPMAETVGAVVRVLLSKKQVCFLLDDVDHYDAASRNLCLELCRSVTGNVNVMLTTQSTLLDPSGLHASIYLDRLPDSEARSLVALLTPAGDSARSHVVEHLVVLGLPLAIVHGVRLLQEGGTVDRADLEQIIARRLGQLTPAARGLLEAVSIHGQSAPLRHVELLLEADVDLAQAEQELRQRALLEPRDDEVVITHELVAQVVHDRMDPQQRKHLHRRMLHLLSSDTAAGIPSGEPVAPGTHLAILAHHAREAQLGTRALDLMEQAGDLALEQHDFEPAALVHYHQAHHWARWKLELSSSSTRFIELTIKLARALLLADHLLSARSVLSGIVEPTQPALALQFHLEGGQLQRARGEVQQAQISLHRAIQLGLAAGQPDHLLMCYLELGELLVEQNQQADALRELTEGLLMVTGGDGEAADDGPFGLWRLVSRLAALHTSSAPERALALARRALFHAQRADSLLGQARCHLQLGQLMINSRQEEEGYESLGTAATLFRRLGHRRRAAECLLLQAHSRSGQGHRNSLASRALALSEQAGWIEGVEQALRITSQP